MSDKEVSLQMVLELKTKLDEVKNAQSETKKLKQNLEELNGTSTKFGDALLKGLGIGAGFSIFTAFTSAVSGAVGEIKSLANEALSMGKEITNTATRVGTTRESVQVLQEVARETSIEFARFEAAGAKLAVAIDKSRDSSSEAGLAFRQLGLDAARLERLPLEKRLEAVAVALLSAKDRSEAFRAASELLGSRNVPALMGALKKLAEEGVDKLGESYKAAGLIASDDTINRLAEAQKHIDEFHHRLVIGAGTSISFTERLYESLKKAPLQTLTALSALLQTGSSPLLTALLDKNSPIQPNGPAPSPVVTPPINTAAVQSLIQGEQKLGEAKENRLKIERELTDVDATIAAIEKNPFLNKEEREQRLAKFYQQQADALTARADALEHEREVLLQVNKLQDQGFRASGDNSPDLVASRDVSNLKAGQLLTPAQLKALSEKRARDSAVGSNRGETTQNGIQQGGNANAQQLLTFGGQLQSQFAQMQAGFATVASSITSVMGSAISSLSNGIEGVINKTETFGQAARQVYVGLAGSVVKAISDMAAEWIVQHTVMAAIGETFRAGESTGHIAMEGTKTTATAVGEGVRTKTTLGQSIARRVIHLGETIFHGIQVAIRTAAHIAGEIAKTAVSIVQAGIRIGVIIVESIASVIQGAVEAFSAMASIPYVGPFLGAAAMAAALVGGFALVKSISKGFADGGSPAGYVSGPGGPRDDKIPARLSNTEYVLNSEATARIGRDRLDKMNFGGAGIEDVARKERISPSSGGSSVGAAAPAPAPAPVMITPKFIVVDNDRSADRINDTSANEAYILKIARKHGML